MDRILIELSNLLYNFFSSDKKNLKVIITGERERELGLVIPAITKCKKTSNILDKEVDAF